jgi:phenylacetate-coenzyme A ligase PaaK-like adenylate-forming protein
MAETLTKPAPATSAAASGDLGRKAAAARARLDEHVREIVRWHFSPETGCPFWLEHAKGLPFDPRDVIGGYDDLQKLGHFQDEWLRGGPVRRWVPKGLADRPVSIFETGGSTGVPKSRINIEDFRIDYEMFSDTLSDATFPRGADWLMLGPSGPRRLRLSIEHLAQHRGGICFMVDLDPRWVNKLIKAGRFQELEAYKAHVIDQGLTVLKAHEIKCLFTTPKLLEALCEKVSLVKAGITGIFCGGTEMTPQFHRFAREELVPGVDFVPTYGNTLMGLACHRPFDPSLPDPERYAITYYPPSPRAVFELVDPKDPQRVVEYGETGRVMLTTLTREFFMPRFLERDEGERAAPIDLYPWDGVTNLRLLSSLQESVVVGVY